MSNQRIVFTNPNGSVGVIIPAPNSKLSVEEIMKKDVPAGATNARICTTDDLPANRVYRAAWDDSNPESFVGTDITKAATIAHERRRANREEQLAPLDKEESFSTTDDIRKAAILTEKQAILDANAAIQINIDKAVDVDALLAIEQVEGLV